MTKKLRQIAESEPIHRSPVLGFVDNVSYDKLAEALKLACDTIDELSEALNNTQDGIREALNGLFRGFNHAANQDLVESQLKIKSALAKARARLEGSEE